MALTRTGVFLEDYLDYSSSLPQELQRLLSTMRELDERSQSPSWNQSPTLSVVSSSVVLTFASVLISAFGLSYLQKDIQEQCKTCLSMPSLQHSKKVGQDQQESVERLRKELEARQDKNVSLCTEKTLLAQQAYDLVDSHVKRLTEDLTAFETELRQDGKAIPLEDPIGGGAQVAQLEKRRSSFMTPPHKRLEVRPGSADRDLERDYEKDKDKARNRDYELMPLPTSQRKRSTPPSYLGNMVNDDDGGPKYCICGRVSFGEMIECDNPDSSAKVASGFTTHAWVFLRVPNFGGGTAHLVKLCGNLLKMFYN
eukprot:SM000002S05693  [mRNA]  locus=s2:1593835:1595758:+ [translate_table: standard]